MKQYARVFRYLKNYKLRIFLYFLFTLLSIAFSIISLGMLMPFLELIFNAGKESAIGGLAQSSRNPVIAFIRERLVQLVSKPEGKLKALQYICVLIVILIFLKNLFLYLANYVLNPIKNAIVNHLRADLYNKVLQLPIGYFTEKRKGDLISRITNDISEVEASVVGTLEGYVRDPLTIIGTFTFLFYLSPQLTFFLLLFLPVMGFVIGRISRSLKRQSNEAALLQGEAVSILDETLGGLRVIKAFNIESVLRNKFFRVNDALLFARNKINNRRDLASPTSELMGVMVLTAILWYGGSGILTGRMPLEGAAFIGYLTFFYQIINPAKTLSTSFSNMKKGEAAITRIEEILQATITVEEKPNGVQLHSFNDCIEFKNVNFAYEGFSILKNII
jgi:subfamily B ATP-binding cassette protein MsbA